MRTAQKLSAVALTLGLVFAAAADVRAQTVVPNVPQATTNYGRTSFNGGVNFNIVVAGERNGKAFTTTAGAFTTTLYGATDTTGTGPSQSYTTYCVDLYQTIGTLEELNASVQNGVVPSNIAGNPEEPVMNIARNIGAAAFIIGQADLATTAIGMALANYTGTSGGQSLAKEKTAAIQLAVWETVFDGITDVNQEVNPVAPFSDGAFRFSTTSDQNQDAALNAKAEQTNVAGLAKQILQLAYSSATGAYRQGAGMFYNFAPPNIAPNNGVGKRQDQLRAVPEPTTLLSGALGFGLLLGLRLRRKKQA